MSDSLSNIVKVDWDKTKQLVEDELIKSCIKAELSEDYTFDININEDIWRITIYFYDAGDNAIQDFDIILERGRWSFYDSVGVLITRSDRLHNITDSIIAKFH